MGEEPATGPALWAALRVAVAERRAWTESRGLLQAIGRQMAADLPLGRCPMLSDLEAAATRQLLALGLGWCRLREGEGALDILHVEAPPVSGPALSVLPAVLEGLFEAWLHAAGADPGLRAEWLRREDGPLPRHRLRFGRPAVPPS